MPTIAQYMTRQPWTIRRGAKLSHARAVMREHRIRHLPVLEGGKLVGIISERDLLLMDRLGEADVDVEEAMTVDVYAVAGTEPVDEIVEQMAAHKYGSVVVVNRRGNVEGIFTVVDGMQVLVDVLRRAAA